MTITLNVNLLIMLSKKTNNPYVIKLYTFEDILEKQSFISILYLMVYMGWLDIQIMT